MNKSRGKVIIYLIILLEIIPICSFSQEKLLMDNWYKYENERFIGLHSKPDTVIKTHGYIHYVVTEDSLYYNISTETRIRKNEKVVFWEMESKNLKDSFLTIKSFILKSNDDKNDVYTIAGAVEKKADSLIWNITGIKTCILTTHYPTVDNFSLQFLMSKLNYQQYGKIIEFDLMNVHDLRCKKEEYLVYKIQEKIRIGDKLITAKKILHSYEGGSNHGCSWLDESNNPVKILIGESKSETICKKEDINFSLFKQN